MMNPIEQKIRSSLRITRLIPAYMPLALARRLIDIGLSRVKLPEGITQAKVVADGVPCVWLTPSNKKSEGVLLYLHGGGFVYGLTPPHFQMAAYLAEKLSMRILLVDYRVAPDHPFPAALDDCVTAYRWLVKQGVSGSKIAIAGDSAGGNLTLTTLMKLREEGDQLPAAGVCLSPVANFAERGEHAETEHDPLLHPRARKFFSESYVADADPRSPYISPLHGDWQGLPPLLIHAGEDEVLRADAQAIAEIAEAQSLDIEVKIFPRMWHVWQLYLTLPEAIQSLDEITSFLTGHLTRQGS
jgi:acetyl esterase/lipase